MTILIERNETAKEGSNPGLTPLDDIHKGRTSTHEPDSQTGRLPAQERDRKSTKRKKTTRKEHK